MDAADFALTRFEAKVDALIGRRIRLALGRYAAVIVLGAPIAWAVSGFHWDRTATYGLVAGVLLYALVRPRPKPRS
jgi:hypothetical protein